MPKLVDKDLEAVVINVLRSALVNFLIARTK